MSADKPLATISQDQLHAYVDGQLSPEMHQAVEAYLRAHPEKSAEVADWKRQNAALEAMYPANTETVRARNLMPKPNRFSRIAPALPRIAATALVLGVGLSGGWLARGSMGDATLEMQQTLVRDAMAAHALYTPEVLHPVEVDAKKETHLVGWLSKRLGAPVSAPDLSEAGYDLIGGRLLPSEQGPAAQFMYENAKGQRITIYATTAAKGVLASFQFERQGELASIYWEDESLRFAIVGALSRGELNQVAIAAYRQLS